MRLIDADELIKDDEVNLWLSNDAVRTGKTLKMFSELFIKKINEQPTVEAIPKAEYETRLNADKEEIKAKYWDKLVDFCKNNKLDTDYVSVFEWANSVAEIIEDGIDELQMKEEK